jgi:hypothetical protein
MSAERARRLTATILAIAFILVIFDDFRLVNGYDLLIWVVLSVAVWVFWEFGRDE